MRIEIPMDNSNKNHSFRNEITTILLFRVRIEISIVFIFSLSSR
jgi:hypothetical protein